MARLFSGRATHVLDASAIIAILMNEPGVDTIVVAGGEGVVSTVNLSESIAKLLDRGSTPDVVLRAIEDLNYWTAHFDIGRAQQAGALREVTRGQNISFADRACLALVIETGLPVLTSDRGWSKLGLPIDIRLIR